MSQRTAGSVWEAGDLVRIVDGLCMGSEAVVTEVHGETHCTVVVLNAARSEGSRQIWPSLHQLEPVSRGWRLGSRVSIRGLASTKLLHLNRATGTVVKHPREEHPAFVTRTPPRGREAQSQTGPQLRVVVRLDEECRKQHKSPTVLMEARFVAPLEEGEGESRDEEDALDETMAVERLETSLDVADELKVLLPRLERAASMVMSDAPLLDKADADAASWTAARVRAKTEPSSPWPGASASDACTSASTTSGASASPSAAATSSDAEAEADASGALAAHATEKHAVVESGASGTEQKQNLIPKDTPIADVHLSLPLVLSGSRHDKDRDGEFATAESQSLGALGQFEQGESVWVRSLDGQTWREGQVREVLVGLGVPGGLMKIACCEGEMWVKPDHNCVRKLMVADDIYERVFTENHSELFDLEMDKTNTSSSWFSWMFCCTSRG